MSKADLEALGRFVNSEVGSQYTAQLKRALVGETIKDLSLSLSDVQVLVLIECNSGQRIELAVPDVDPEWEFRVTEDLMPDAPASRATHSMGMVGVKEPAPEEKKEEEPDGTEQS